MWDKILVKLTKFIIWTVDKHFWIIFAGICVLSRDYTLAAWGAILAIYEKLTDIRDAVIKQNEVFA